MARIAKSKDQANWRKGKDLRVGDMVAVKWDNGSPTEYSAIVSEDGKKPYMSVTNYTFTLANGGSLWCGGGEFAEGQYQV